MWYGSQVNLPACLAWKSLKSSCCEAGEVSGDERLFL